MLKGLLVHLESLVNISLLFLFACTGTPEETNRNENMIQIVDPDHSQGQYWIDQFEFPNKALEKPQAYSSFTEAQTACQDAGKRLCTASEWRRACLGTKGKRFGYGYEYEQRTCKSAVTLPSGHSSMMDPTKFLSKSGEREHCKTDEGVFDMIGNLEEWVLDDWQGAPASLEGGAWYTYMEYADCTGRYSRQPDYRTPLDRKVFSAGFRCCLTEEEVSLEEVARDAKERLEGVSVAGDYVPENEVQLAKNTFIDRFEYPNRLGEKPLYNVSWKEAKQRCQDADKRLCQTYEWEFACAGDKHWKYPYGNDFIPSACAIQESEATASGAFFGCISPSGVQDMIGSVWEWTASGMDAKALKTDTDDSLYEIRGGSWFVDPEKGLCRPSDGYPVAASTNLFPDLGFRCCRGDALPLPQNIHYTQTCPPDMKAIGDSCIDQYEYPNKEGQEPVYDPSFSQAKTLCESQSKHLCTTDEWSLACEGQEKRRWSYGNHYDPHTCHDQGYSREEGGMVQRSGSFPNCKTPEEIFDLTGNLWEWTMDVVNSDIGYLKGGGWNLSAGLGQCRVSAPAQSTFHSGELGFRCCANQQELTKLLEK